MATITNVAISGSQVTLTVDVPVIYGANLIVSYTKGTNPLQNPSGNQSVNLVNEVITNNILDTTAPTIPNGLVSSLITKKSFTVLWEASTDSESGLDFYEVFLDTVSQGTTTNLSWNFDKLVSNTSFNITIKSQDIDGNLSVASTIFAVSTLEDSAAVSYTSSISVLL